MSIARRFQRSHHWPYRVGAALPTGTDPLGNSSTPDASGTSPAERATDTLNFVGGLLIGIAAGAIGAVLVKGKGKYD